MSRSHRDRSFIATHFRDPAFLFTRIATLYASRKTFRDTHQGGPAAGKLHSAAPMARLQLLFTLMAALAPLVATAKANGIATTGCTGCHAGGQVPTTTVTLSDNGPATGATIVLTVSFTAVNGGGGGLYLRASEGAFTVIGGQSTRLINARELVHSAPKGPANGKVTFQVSWTAPSAKGGADFDAWVLAGNGNLATTGDGAGAARSSVAYGCVGISYYRDYDGDGVGATSSGTTRNCAAPMGYSAEAGDCDDNDEKIFPGQAELCDSKDNDCDGLVDEDLMPQTFYPDADGDGYGIQSTLTVMGCIPPEGYALTKDDCADDDAQRHPGADEVCNFHDDDCDGKIDEGARVICGVGMCARYGISCDPKLCTPGAPVPEVCNYLDDDCDGVIDNAASCPSGQACVEGACTAASSTGDAGADGGDGGADDSSAVPGGCAAGPSVPLLFAGLWLIRGPRRRR